MVLAVNHLVGFGAGQSNPKLFDVLTDLGLTTNLKMCLDAGDATSYASGQKWLDLSGSGNDMFLGTDGTVATDDPTHNGTPGGLSSSEFFAYDGGDFFEYDAANEPWMENMHKNNALFSAIALVKFVTDNTKNHALMTTGNGASNTIWTGWYIGGSDEKQAFQVGDGSSPTSIAKTADNALPDGWHFLGISIYEAGGGGSFLYRDGGYDAVSTDAWDAAYSGPSASAAQGPFQIGAFNDSPAPNINQIALFAAWENSGGGAHILTKSNMDDIFARVRGRMGI